MTNSIPSRSSNIRATLKPSTLENKKKKRNEDDDNDPKKPFKATTAVPPPPRSFFREHASLLNTGIILKLGSRYMLGVTVILYVLNQKHMLPMKLGSVVSRVLFWPTFPLTISGRFGNWITEIDEVVLLGGAPVGFAMIPERLYHDYGVRSVINLCEEYRGPVNKYKKLGMKQLRLKTIDHFEPSFEDLKRGVEFLQENEMNGNRVYIHCRAGHGRSSAVVMAWLIHKNPFVDLKVLNDELLKLRRVRTYLWTQPNIRKFQDWARSSSASASSSEVNGKKEFHNNDSFTAPNDGEDDDETITTALSSSSDGTNYDL